LALNLPILKMKRPLPKQQGLMELSLVLDIEPQVECTEFSNAYTEQENNI
jgi:hypothetical protein